MQVAFTWFHEVLQKYNHVPAVEVKNKLLIVTDGTLLYLDEVLLQNNGLKTKL